MLADGNLIQLGIIITPLKPNIGEKMKRILMVLLIATLLLTACGAKSDVASTGSDDPSAAGSTEVASEPQDNSAVAAASKDDLSGALNILLGTTDTPSVFESYHLEMVLDTPQANDDYTAVVNEKVSISADVAGKNVHILQIDPGETTPKEGYIISDTDKEYKLVDGVWQEMMGQIALGWAMWPMQVVMPYAYTTSVYAGKLDIEEVDGRKAIAYELDTAKADAALLASMKAFGLGEFTGTGKVWIDKETGALLKLQLDYTQDVYNADASAVVAPGTGSITMEVSKVNQVTVTSPQ
ncbi:MAG: hypothetical protein C0410_13175 [Anaerolinea sp.]|nr:hypothetical protein [Anaerolinea sp.]